MSHTSRLAILPGTFDPLTNGHRELVARTVALFDRVVVVVLVNHAKQPLFPLEERLAMIRGVVAEWPAVEVASYDGLLADYMRERRAAVVVRGARSAPEFAAEAQIASMNRHLYAGCETVFLAPTAATAHISSTLVREIASFGGSVDGLVPASVAAALAARWPRRS